ncbi:MAG: dihydrolipoamide acetyltransferase, partial [Rhodocyclales bacterium]|nr:dihydrolipoamide acetyltransferase [Rhodocyclales bacterium]
MSQLIDIKVPDIGDFTDVPVIEVFVKPGDVIKVDDALVTLESDKATMDVPASAAGVVKEVLVKLGDRIGEGAVVVRVEASDSAAAPQAAVAASSPAPAAPAADLQAAAPATGGGVVDVKVPDIGDFAEVPVIEVFVKPGDVVKVDDALVTLESDKATMDVPSSAAGTVKEVLVKLGDKVGEGTVIVRLEGGVVASST